MSRTSQLLSRSVSFVHVNPAGTPDAAPTTRDVKDFTSLYYDSGVSLGGVCSADWGLQKEPC